MPSHSAPAPQAHRKPTPQGRHQRTQRGRRAQPRERNAIRTHREEASERGEADVPSHSGPASIMQFDPTGKTQASAEGLTCPATLHRARVHA